MPVQFELVSPERLIVSAEVDMVVVPGTEGNFGVLPGHAPLISTIRPGTIDIYQGGAVSERIFVVGGIAEVTPERCTVLAERRGYGRRAAGCGRKSRRPPTRSTAARSKPSCRPQKATCRPCAGKSA